MFEQWRSRLIPLGAGAAAFAIGGLLILALGANPVEGYGEMVVGAFGSGRGLSDTALKAMPLLLVGTGICISFRAGVINIGGEGQMIAGALLSTILALVLPDLPAVILVPTVLVAGAVGGGLWGAVPGVLKAVYGVSEILSTIMLNIVAVQLMNFLLKDPLIDPAEVERGTRIPQTERLSPNADLPVLVGRIHLGVVVAVVAAVVGYLVLWRTPAGFRLRAVGHNPHASGYAGIPVRTQTVLALTYSGAMAGLAGAVTVFGSVSHRLVTDGSAAGFTGAAGYNGIVAALFGALHPLWTIPSSILFGGLLVGANAMQRAIQVPAALIQVINGIVVIFVVASARLRQRMDLKAEKHQVVEAVHGATP